MLPANWWIQWRDEDPIHAALVQAHCVYWSGCVDEVLSENERTDRGPHSWEHIAAALYRDARNLRRWYRGRQYRYAPHAFLALSAVVGIEVSELFPASLTWMATTVRILCGSGASPVRYSSGDCRILAACCLLQSGPEPLCLDDVSIAAAFEQCGAGNDRERAARVTREVYAQLEQRLEHLLDRHG